MTKIDPVEIARRLSPGQRRALLWLPADGGLKILSEKGTPHWTDRLHLRAMGLMDADCGVGFGRRATPLGLEVRAVLETEGPCIAMWCDK